jgi:hypothetical protein
VVRRKPYQWVVRVVSTGAYLWQELDGELAAAGVAPFELSFRRLCNLIYARILKTAVTQESRDKLVAELLSPLPGRNPSPEQEQKIAEDEMAAFGKAMAQT